jgi:hypothetical protein
MGRSNASCSVNAAQPLCMLGPLATLIIYSLLPLMGLSLW